MRWQLRVLQLEWSYGDTPAARRETVRQRLTALAPVSLVVLPELWPVGFFRFDEYADAAEPFDGPTLAMCAEFAAARECYVLTGSFVERGGDGRLHNTSVLLGPSGEAQLVYRKVHLFGYRSREPELLTPGDALPVVDTPLGRVGVGTCYDLRFPEFYRTLTDRGAEIVLVPSAWPMARRGHWELLLRARAVENQLLVVGCNMAGADDGSLYAGASAVVGPDGRVLAEAGAGDEELAASIPRGMVEAARREFPVLNDRMLAGLDDSSLLSGGRT